jgi:hypothetical protein
MKKQSNKYTIAIIIVLVVVAAVSFFVVFSRGTNPVAKDPATIALSQTDVSNIPNGLVYNSTSSEQTYKLDASWFNDSSQRQAAIDMGFIDGYYDYFFYQNPNSFSNIKTIGSSISIYNKTSSAGIATNATLNQIMQSRNCISFNLPTIGDGSYGCYFVLNVSNTAISYYDVLFYKNNVAVRVWVGQTGLVDLSAEAVQYADTVANRI